MDIESRSIIDLHESRRLLNSTDHVDFLGEKWMVSSVVVNPTVKPEIQDSYCLSDLRRDVCFFQYKVQW